METIIYTNGYQRIITKKTIETEAIELLKRISYGTKGLRYRQVSQVENIKNLYDPTFFYLYENEHLIGFYCLDHRVIDQFKSSYYGRYFVIDTLYQEKGFGTLLKTEAIRFIERNDPTSILFSFIEDKNKRSLNVSYALNFKSISSLNTYIYRSLFPKLGRNFYKIDESRKSTFQQTIAKTYVNYSFVNLDKLFENDSYFILKEGDQITAGAKAYITTWQFDNFPGIQGFIFLHIIPHLPILKRLFNRQYTFLTLDSIYLSAYNEHALPILIESLLAHFNLNSALFLLDKRDQLSAYLEKKKFLTGGLQPTIKTNVVAKFNSSEQMDKFEDNIIYVSGFDFT